MYLLHVIIWIYSIYYVYIFKTLVKYEFGSLVRKVTREILILFHFYVNSKL